MHGYMNVNFGMFMYLCIVSHRKELNAFGDNDFSGRSAIIHIQTRLLTPELSIYMIPVDII
jgi:hypothetical protein